jgi:hypothetical protein
MAGQGNHAGAGSQGIKQSHGSQGILEAIVSHVSPVVAAAD